MDPLLFQGSEKKKAKKLELGIGYLFNIEDGDISQGEMLVVSRSRG